MRDWYRSHLAPWATRIEETIDRLLPPAEAPPALLHGAMRYSVLGGGKRLRGILAVTACQAAGGRPEEALPLAAALEMIHAYSLVHDDLPAMDDDVLRRGKPTTHIRFGEDIAILAGDALLTHAFIVLGRLPQVTRVDAATALAIVQEVADAAGSEGLVGGQVADLQAEGRTDVPVAELQAIHARKTGALFRASVRTGARLAGADDATLQLLDEYARSFGLAFQIADDVLDVTGDEAALGKHVGSDAAKDKSTYVTRFGPEEALRRAQSAADEAVRAVAPLGEKASLLQRIAAYAVARDR